jgi:subtilase family serine protease
VYKPTNVISISYGGGEQDLPMSYQRRQCNEFMKLGIMGISVCVASGDYGVEQPTGKLRMFCYFCTLLTLFTQRLVLDRK